MERVATAGERQVWLHELARPYRLETPFPGEEYVCILFANDETITPEEQEAISEQLVATGCRYAVCAGHRCSTWDDSVDLAYLATDESFSPPDETFVTTTWHEGEPIEEVLHFGFNLTGAFTRFLVLLVGPGAEVRRAIPACWQSSGGC
jgi:hypothetical protein